MIRPYISPLLLGRTVELDTRTETVRGEVLYVNVVQRFVFIQIERTTKVRFVHRIERVTVIDEP